MGHFVRVKNIDVWCKNEALFPFNTFWIRNPQTANGRWEQHCPNCLASEGKWFCTNSWALYLTGMMNRWTSAVSPKWTRVCLGITRDRVNLGLKLHRKCNESSSGVCMVILDGAWTQRHWLGLSGVGWVCLALDTRYHARCSNPRNCC